MRTFCTFFAIAQLILLVSGSEVTAERKRVKCLYFGPLIEKFGLSHPEDINATICTHLVYIPLENYTTGEIFLMPNNSRSSTSRVDIVSGLAQLKSANPELKLILHITYVHLMWAYIGSSEKSNLIQNGTKWLRENGFDGIDIPIPNVPDEIEDMVELICEIKTEFDKHGFIVMTTLEEVEADDFPQPSEGKEDIVSKMARCCDYIVLRRTVYNNTVTHLLTPLSLIESNVDLFSRRGLPLDKILFTIMSTGNIFTLTNPKQTALGAKVSGPGHENDDLGHLIYYKTLMRKVNDSSLGWTIHRDDETKEAYAFTTTGLWASFEDRASLEFKARYVMEKGLGGIEVDNIDTDDDGGDERFPLTRAIHDTFARGLQTADTTD